MKDKLQYSKVTSENIFIKLNNYLDGLLYEKQFYKTEIFKNTFSDFEPISESLTEKEFLPELQETINNKKCLAGISEKEFYDILTGYLNAIEQGAYKNSSKNRFFKQFTRGYINRIIQICREINDTEKGFEKLSLFFILGRLAGRLEAAPYVDDQNKTVMVRESHKEHHKLKMQKYGKEIFNYRKKYLELKYNRKIAVSQAYKDFRTNHSNDDKLKNATPKTLKKYLDYYVKYFFLYKKREINNLV